MVAHRYPEAIAQISKVLERDPSFSPAHFYLSQVYALDWALCGRGERIAKKARVREATPGVPGVRTCRDTSSDNYSG